MQLPGSASFRPRGRVAAASWVVVPLLALFLVGRAPRPIQAQTPWPEDAPTLHPLSGLGEHFIGAFADPGNLLLHGSAIAGTALMAFTVDRPIQDAFQRENPLGQDLSRAVLDVGEFSTLAVSGGLYLSGLAAGETEIINGGAAALQAVGITFVVVTALKFITGRFGPPDPIDANGERPEEDGDEGWWRNSEDPADFQFNPFAERGLFWPSGHTSSHFALASALVSFFRSETWMPWVLYPIAALVGIAMIDGDYHWASDVLAGGLIGHAIGWTVGSGFRERSREAADELGAASMALFPAWVGTPSAETVLIGVSGAF